MGNEDTGAVVADPLTSSMALGMRDQKNCRLTFGDGREYADCELRDTVGLTQDNHPRMRLALLLARRWPESTTPRALSTTGVLTRRRLNAERFLDLE